MVAVSPGPEVIKRIFCSTQLSMKFKLFINTEIAKKSMGISGLNHESHSLNVYIYMPTIVAILTFMSRINFRLSCVEYEKSFITSGALVEDLDGLDAFLATRLIMHANYW